MGLIKEGFEIAREVIDMIERLMAKTAAHDEVGEATPMYQTTKGSLRTGAK